MSTEYKIKPMEPKLGDAWGPNVMRIRARGTLIIRAGMPRQVRNELMLAVKGKGLGRLKKDGLKPEIFYHPDHKNLAMDLQKKEALYSIDCIKNVVC